MMMSAAPLDLWLGQVHFPCMSTPLWLHGFIFPDYTNYHRAVEITCRLLGIVGGWCSLSMRWEDLICKISTLTLGENMSSLCV